MGSELELQDGTAAITLCATPIFRTAEPGVGWVTGAWGVVANDGSGELVDFRERSIAVGSEETFNWEVLNDESAAPASRRRFSTLKSMSSIPTTLAHRGYRFTTPIVAMSSRVGRGASWCSS